MELKVSKKQQQVTENSKMSDLLVSVFRAKKKKSYFIYYLFEEKVPKPVNEAAVVYMKAGLRILAGVWTRGLTVGCLSSALCQKTASISRRALNYRT